MSVSGFISAIHLLIKQFMNVANEEDRRRLHECEERLATAGYGNYKDLQVPGTVTKNFVTACEKSLKDTDQCETRRKISELDEQLRSAGFDDYFDAATINSLAKILKLNQFIVIENKEHESAENLNIDLPENTSEEARDAKQHAIKSRVGILSAINLLYELELGIISYYDLRKLGVYEERLKLMGFGSDASLEVLSTSKELHATIRLEDLQWPPSTLGTVINYFLIKLRAKLASIKDSEARALILESYEKQLQCVGLGDHYDSLEIEELTKDFENMRRTRGKVYCEEPDEEEKKNCVTVKTISSNEITDKASPVLQHKVRNNAVEYLSKEKTQDELTGIPSETPVEGVAITPKSYHVQCKDASIDINVLLERLHGIKPAEASNATEARREMPRAVSMDLPPETMYKLPTTLSVETAASKTEIDVPSNCINVNEEPTQNLRKEPDTDAERISAESVEVESEHMPRTGFMTAAYLLLKIKSGQASDDEKEMFRECEERLKLTGISCDTHIHPEGFEPFPELGKIMFNFLLELNSKINTEPAPDRETRNKTLYTYINKLKSAGFDRNYNITEDGEIWNGLEDALSKIYKETMPNEATRTFCAGQSGTSRLQVEKETSRQMSAGTSDQIEDGHAAEGQAIKNEEAAGVKKAVPCEANDYLGDYEKVNESNETVDSTWKLVKIDTPTPPLRPSEPRRSEETSLKDPRVTYVPVNVKSERKLVVARRRLQSQSPVDWFSTEPSEPPPGFNTFYAQVYSELPLSCRAYAFSERLKEIDCQLNNTNKPTANLLRKEYSYVVDAFDRYLSTVQKRSSMAAPTYIQRRTIPRNQEKWRKEIIICLFMTNLDDLPKGLSLSPLYFNQTATARASAVAERLKMIEVKLGQANAQQALILSKEFGEILASYDKPCHYPVPGEPYEDPEVQRPLPDELEYLRMAKNDAHNAYHSCPSEENRQIRSQLVCEYRRRLAIWNESEGQT